MTVTSAIALDTPIIKLFEFGIPRLGRTTARKLALAIAALTGKEDANEATVEDLLYYLPSRYEDRSNLAQISGLFDGIEASLELCVRVAAGYQVGRNRNPRQPKLYIFEVSASDPARTGRPVVIWWFVSGRNAQRIIAYNRDRFTQGARFIVFGKWEWDARRGTFALKLQKPDEIEMLSGSWANSDNDLLSESNGEGRSQHADAGDLDPSELIDGGEDDASSDTIHVGRRVPIYRKLGDLRSKQVREIIHELLSRLDDDAIRETLPEALRTRQRLVARADAIRRIHFPTEIDLLKDYERARSPSHVRLIFEEFFSVALALGLRKRERLQEPKGARIVLDEAMRKRMAAVLPFSLTRAQRRVVKSIFGDMQSNAPMNRLLQGDVGSGKTIVALLAMLAALENGYQTALMAPTEILAEQHARNIKRILASTTYRVELLAGSMRQAEKRRLQVDIAAGDVHAVIGTHALIQEAVTFKNLGLAVIDEQHRFGVMQRAELRERGFYPDVLVMTATPIPRSLAMTAYGDLDVSVIDELPPGRTPIKTVVVGEDKREGVYKGVEREIKAGRQVYVVYPLVAESEKLDLKDATRMFEQLCKRFPDTTVGLLHGKMKSAEKDEVMRRFVEGETKILVATTVVEVGVDVPNASLMIIEHAERFGLSQLHQLRGRVGRGARKSFCVLVASDKQTSVAQERLGIMEETSDGFRIAERDLEIRGPGEIMGTRQSGVPTFRVGNLVRDLAILEKAKREADRYLSDESLAPETTEIIDRIRSQPKFGLAIIG